MRYIHTVRKITAKPCFVETQIAAARTLRTKLCYIRRTSMNKCAYQMPGPPMFWLWGETNRPAGLLCMRWTISVRLWFSPTVYLVVLAPWGACIWLARLIFASVYAPAYAFTAYEYAPHLCENMRIIWIIHPVLNVHLLCVVRKCRFRRTYVSCRRTNEL